MPGGPIILDPLKGKIGNIENDHKIMAAKTAASKIEVAKGGYTPKTTPATAEVRTAINDTPNPPKTSSMATILDTNDKKVPKWKAIFRNPLSGGDTKPSIELGHAPYTPKVTGGAGGSGTSNSVVDIQKTSSRATDLSHIKPTQASADAGKIELGKGSYSPKIDHPASSLSSDKGKLSSTDWYEKSPSSKAVKLGEVVSGSAGEDVSAGSKILSGASKVLEVGSKFGKVAGPAAVVAGTVGFLADPGNLAKDGYVKIGNDKIKTGPSAPNYFGDVGKALTDTYGPGWRATATGYTRDLYVDGKISGAQTVDTATLQITQKGTGTADNITAVAGSDGVAGAENSSPNRTVSQKDTPGKGKGPEVVSYGQAAAVDPVVFSGTTHQPAGWKPENSSKLEDQKTDQTVVIDGKQRKGVTVDIFADGRQVFHDSGGNVIGYKGTSIDSQMTIDAKGAALSPAHTGAAMGADVKPTTGESLSARANELRGEAMNQKYGLGNFAPQADANHDGTVSPAEATQARSEALNKEYGLGKPATSTPSATTTPTPSWETAGVSPNLGGIGGSDLSAHGNALAMRDSKDGSKFITQMSDGTYESVDKTTGAVAGAGTWGDGQGGGVAVNGVGNSPNDASAVGPVAVTNPKGTLDPALNTTINASGTNKPDVEAVGPVAITNPKVDPAPDAVDRFVANHPTDITSTAPKSDVSDIVSRAVANQTANEATQHAAMLQTKDQDLMPSVPTHSDPPVSQMAPTTAEAQRAAATSGVVLLDSTKYGLPTAQHPLAGVDTTSHVTNMGHRLGME